MPTYDYKCLDCNYKIESLHKINEEKSFLCLECGSILEKCIGSGSAVHFKGSGFWETDYKRK